MCMYIYILEQEKNYCYFNSDYFWEIGVKVIFKIFFFILYNMGFPGGSVVKNPPANAGDIRDACLIPRSGRFPGVGNSSPIQYSCLENSMDREAWWATVHGTAGSDTTAWLRTHSEQHKYYFSKNQTKRNINKNYSSFSLGERTAAILFFIITFMYFYISNKYSLCIILGLLYSSWGSHGRYTGVVCHSPLQWIGLLSELSALTWQSWVALHSMAHSFIEFCKPLRHDKGVVLKPLTVWIMTSCRKLLHRWKHQTILPVSWETYMQVKKQQLEPCMEQLIGSRQRKE